MTLTQIRPSLATVDGQPLNVASLPGLVQRIMDMSRRGHGFTLFTMNLDHLVKRRREPAFRDAYRRATLVSADGWPVALLARRQGAMVERVTGADLVLPLCEAAARESVPVFLLGSTTASLRGAAVALTERCPGLDVRGIESPPMGFDPVSPSAEAVADRVAASGARLCFVALGAPKQELFADAMSKRHPEIGYLCIGAGLDFLSGHQRRAPALVQRMHLEWFWRMAGNPRRLAVRYAACAAVLLDVLLRVNPSRPI